MAIRRILIANRGEIAARIIRTCRALGIETVLAVSSADRDGEPARQADRVVCIGPAKSADSYLNAAAIVHAAVATGADAIHPGYGFLSERAALPQLCGRAGIVFIGPTADQIVAIGDKLRARAEAETANVPVVPGGAANSHAEAQALARKIGAPLLVKAVGGGGGRGLKVTEAVTGLDLIAEQIAIADGSGLRLRQSEVRTMGCAIECRINAEDYRNEFRPSPGRVRDVSWPSGCGIRVDSHVVPGSSIPPFYDSLMGKIIASGKDRAMAIARPRGAIAATRISGVKSNLGFHSAALDDPEFQTGGVDTGFVDRLYARRPDLCDQREAGASYG
jgi:acetyl/propionyl-CoA carboxylase alpha subunit